MQAPRASLQVLRLLPAMNLLDAELEEGCGILAEVLCNLDARG